LWLLDEVFVKFGFRKLFIAALSFGGVLGIYLLYSYISRTPPLDVDAGERFLDRAGDSNAGKFDDEIGKIGDVGVRTLKRPKFLHRNKDKEVDREFGFEELLHEEKDRWEIEKPYLKIFQPTFNCYVTADKGEVEIESAAGKPTPKDATFTGNVVVYILPEESGTIKESMLYLDDVVFLGEKTQFSTAGPVKFVSEDVQMLGTGLEVIYNDQLQRLEYLRIVDLKTLHIKSSQAASPSSPIIKSDRPGDANRAAASPKSQRADSKKAATLPASKQQQNQRNEGEYYRCVCSKNVVIDSAEQLIFAEEKLFINNIFWSRASTEKSDAAKTADTNNVRTQTPPLSPSPAPAATVARRGSGQESMQARTVEPNKPPERVVDIVVTCDGGIIVAPMDSLRTQENSDKGDVKPASVNDSVLRDIDDGRRRTIFIARRIDYDASTESAVADGSSILTFYTSNATGAESQTRAVPVKITAQKQTKFLPALNQVIFEGDCLCVMPQGDPNEQRDYTLSAPMLTVNLPKDESGRSGGPPDIVAAGPVELTFYVDDFNGVGNKKDVLPAQLNAQKQAKFLAAPNQVIFEGDCVCAMLREDPNVQERYVLTAPVLTVNLPKDANDKSSTLTSGVKYLTATGGVVRLATVKMSGKKLLGGIELKCRRVDYDADRELFLAIGPGVIKIDNSGVSEPVAERGGFTRQTDGGFSMRRPCYVFVQNFDTLKYFASSNRMVADARSQGTLLIDFIPIIKGKYGEQIVATANHIEADLVAAEGGQTELSTVTSSGGITFEDEKNQFAGGKLFYDHVQSIMKVTGDPPGVPGGQSCYFNGTLVDGIEYNLKTGKIKAKVVGPGTLKINK
jgi:hypothetical protein